MKQTTTGVPAPSIWIPPKSTEQVVQAFFGRSSENVMRPLHRAIECMTWLGALFTCIEDVNNGDRATGAVLVQNLSSLGAYVAGEFQVNVIGQAAEEMQAHIDAFKGGEA
jgi:hypothetical protein